jgi:hypothetical protein
MDDDDYGLAYVSDNGFCRASGSWLRPTDVGAMPHVDLFRKLTATELHEIRQDTACILGFFSSKNLLRSLELNLKDLQSTCEIYLQPFDNRRIITPEALEEQSFNLGRLLFNLLSAFRSFLNHTDVMIKRCYRGEIEATQWLQAKDAAYKASLAYRLMYYLRDYAEHVAIPSITVYVSQDEPARLEFDRDEFLDDIRQAGKKCMLPLREELARQAPKITFPPLLVEWWGEISNLSRRLTKIQAESVEEATHRILRWRTLDTSPGSGDLYVMNKPIQRHDGIIPLRMLRLPEEEAARVIAMALRQAE